MKKPASNAVRRLALSAAVLLPAVLLAAPLLASHAWNDYHWKRTTAQLAIPVGDNVDANWDSYLTTAVDDWNVSTVIQSTKVAGTTNPKNCRAVRGTIQVCNGRYGNTGWLGIATISLSGGHITQGTSKLNDTYFSTPQYNTPSWKALVMCQEYGHDYGLGHQDEDFSTDGTNSCMDYTSQPANNEHPDAHDYEQLEIIYAHSEIGAALPPGGNASIAVDPGDTPAAWGRAIHADAQGRPDMFERIDGPGQKTITHVFWTLDHDPRGHHDH
jgi:hypothetical protein